MKLVAVLFFLLTTAPAFASTLIECKLNATIQKNYGIIQPGTEFLQINIPLNVVVDKADPSTACGDKIGKSFSIQLAVPLAALDPLQIGLKDGNSIKIQYVYIAPRGKEATEKWTLLEAPVN